MNTINATIQRSEPWNKGKLTGQKAPLRLRDLHFFYIGPHPIDRIDETLRRTSLIKITRRGFTHDELFSGKSLPHV